MTSSWILPIVPGPSPESNFSPEEEKIRNWVIYRETSGCPIVRIATESTP